MEYGLWLLEILKRTLKETAKQNSGKKRSHVHQKYDM